MKEPTEKDGRDSDVSSSAAALRTYERAHGKNGRDSDASSSDAALRTYERAHGKKWQRQ
jgi:hypothetical protein